MWNRKDNEIPGSSPAPRSSEDAPPRKSIVSNEFESAPPPSSSSQVQRTPRGTVGKSIVIRGELTGNEDLTIEGKVEGKIDLMDHNLIIGSSGRIKAEIGAKKVVVEGEVNGNINAGEKVELAATGRVKGDIIAPRVVIADGATFKGMVNMSDDKDARTGTTSDSEKKSSPKSESENRPMAAAKTA